MHRAWTEELARRRRSRASTSPAYLRAWALEARWRRAAARALRRALVRGRRPGSGCRALAQGQRLPRRRACSPNGSETSCASTRSPASSPSVAAFFSIAETRPCASGCAARSRAPCAAPPAVRSLEPGLDLRCGQLVVGGDREAGAHAGAAPQPVRLGQRPVGGVAGTRARPRRARLPAGALAAAVACLRRARPCGDLRWTWFRSFSRSCSRSSGCLRLRETRVGDDLRWRRSVSSGRASRRRRGRPARRSRLTA